MAVKIRLTRTGKKSQPHFRIIAIDESKKNDGKNIAILGSYHPLQEESVDVNREEVEKWLKKGAQPSFTVKKLLKI